MFGEKGKFEMNIIERIKYFAGVQPLALAMISGDEEIRYQELDSASDYLAAYLDVACGDDFSPIPVYGHKSVYMLICMLACVKSGRAYCPMDISTPDSRTQVILNELESPVVLATETLQYESNRVINKEEIKDIIKGQQNKCMPDKWIKGDQVFYIIFTSGSTGKPKGVQITADCLNHYLDWSVDLGNAEDEKTAKVFLNQAPFSFDLSVMDLYTCLACGGTLWSLSKAVQSDYKLLMQSLNNSNAAIWVSTPSFAEICLSDKQFNEQLLPNLKVFLFCGETLANDTAGKLMQRFPQAVIVNTYGPTESTVAVTSVEIGRAWIETANPLPLGQAKDGTRIEIRDENDQKVEEGVKGEIIILGNTVSIGYYKSPELTQKSFFTEEHNGEQVRGYRTGDQGYIENDLLYYCGRIDLQVKLHGYRMEMEDIENNLMNLNDIDRAVVLPNMKDGKAKSLSAYVVYKGKLKDQFEAALELKKDLKEFLPDYMIPKKIIFLEEFPVNNNGKIDRKLLGGLSK